MNNKTNAERLYFALPEAIRRQDRHGIYKAIASELDRIDSEERQPMTDSALVQEVRQAINECHIVHFPSIAELNLRSAASRLCDNYEAAIERGLKAERALHDVTKRLEALDALALKHEAERA